MTRLISTNPANNPLPTFRFVLLSFAILIAAVAVYIGGAYFGLYGNHQVPGAATPNTIPASVINQRTKQQEAHTRKFRTDPSKQILFGDLHVHTTFSSDAFQMSLPMAVTPFS